MCAALKEAGVTLYGLGRYSEAEALFRRIIALPLPPSDPAKVEAHNGLGAVGAAECHIDIDRICSEPGGSACFGISFLVSFDLLQTPPSLPPSLPACFSAYLPVCLPLSLPACLSASLPPSLPPCLFLLCHLHTRILLTLGPKSLHCTFCPHPLTNFLLPSPVD